MNNDKNLTEEEIINRILSGEKTLYEIIVKRYNSHLYKIGRSYNFNHDDAQDLMQDTYIDAYKNLNKFNGQSRFKTWLVRIMLNNCYRKKEERSFKNELPSEINDSSTPVFKSSGHGSSDLVYTHELENTIENALNHLPEDYRTVFSLREMNGFNTSETAHLLNISESNVKTRLSRAKTMLQKEITTVYSPEELYEFNAVFCDPFSAKIMGLIVDN